MRHLLWERCEAAAQRRARAVLPARAVDDVRSGRLELVRALHHDDRLDAVERGQYGGQECTLLRRAVARRGPGGEHDGGDHRVRIVMCRTTTRFVGFSVAGSPSLPMRSTTASPPETRPRTA